MSNRVLCREASHAGSWYTASGMGWGTRRRGGEGGGAGPASGVGPGRGAPRRLDRSRAEERG